MSSQKEMLFRRGKRHIGRADHQRHKPVAETADQSGMTTKNTMIRPCAVMNDVPQMAVGRPRPVQQKLHAGVLQLGRIMTSRKRRRSGRR
jgi:hypothetical protein